MNSVKHEIARKLLEVKAVRLQPTDPFTLASGWKSPIYCDNRLTLSYPEVRAYISKALADLVRELYPEATMICGVATGAIASGVLVAEHLGLPFCYVRSKAKDHGRGNQIEGRVEPGDKIVVVEDLISTGGSSLKAVAALREAGLEVLGMVANYTHQFAQAEQAFAEAGVELHTLTNYDALIEEAVRSGVVGAGELETLKEWRQAPDRWMKE